MDFEYEVILGVREREARLIRQALLDEVFSELYRTARSSSLSQTLWRLHNDHTCIISGIEAGTQ